jgi:hypothetical protein
METVAEDMIMLLIKKCKSKNVKKGLEIALDIVSNSGYYNYSDCNNMTEKEQWNEVKEYLK